jgi:hypothetical protein
MQDVLVAVGFVALFAAFLALFAWGFRRQIRRRKEAEQTWRAYAARRHLEWSDAPRGAWYSGKSYSMCGSIDGLALTFDQFMVGAGDSRERCSRVAAELARPAPERLIITPKSALNRFQIAFQGPVVEVAPSRDGAELLVRCRSAEFARSKIDDRLRAALRAMPRRTFIECSDKLAKVWWSGAERDPAVLDRAAALLARVVA